MRLYEDEKKIIEKEDEETLHNQFVQNDITGTDVMAFACHLTGLSLSAKNLSVYTDFLRISVMNALRLDSDKLPFKIEEARGDISKELEAVHDPQPSIDSYIKPRKQTTIQSKSFTVDKVDIVLLNPPFTNMNRLPMTVRQNFCKANIGKVCGNRIFLWGYFLALAEKVVADGGRIGAITPISLLHGQDTLCLRQFFLKNYTIEYIIKSVVGKPFSEGANFTDIIFIAKKTPPKADQKTRIICLKEDISDFSSSTIENLAITLRAGYYLDVEDTARFLSFRVNQSELLLNAENLMPYVFTNNKDVKCMVELFADKVKAANIFKKVDLSKVEEGYQFRPRGTADHTIITRVYPEGETSARTQNSGLIFKKNDETTSEILYYNSGTSLPERVTKTRLEATFRTPIGIDTLDASNITDYILKDRVRKKIGKKEKAHLLISNRLWLKSKEQSLTALYSDNLIAPLNIFTMYKCPKPDAKILCLYFNSIFYLTQALTVAKQSTRGFLGIKIIDFCRLFVPNLSQISSEEKKRLEEFFDANRNRKIESIPVQLQLATEYRLSLDLEVAKGLGIKISKEQLLEAYRLAWNHISSLP
jgi:hypothetical protein